MTTKQEAIRAQDNVSDFLRRIVNREIKDCPQQIRDDANRLWKHYQKWNGLIVMGLVKDDKK